MQVNSIKTETSANELRILTQLLYDMLMQLQQNHAKWLQLWSVFISRISVKFWAL